MIMGNNGGVLSMLRGV